MNRARLLLARVSQYPLALALPVQALLLFWNLNLLPLWMDEGHTLWLAPRPPMQIARMVAGDIHPPLYFLLVHWWASLPLPGDLALRVRALSAVWMLAATVVVDRLWLAKGRVPAGARRWFLALWALSPCLLLYGRMARSYAMQVCLVAAALAAARALAKEPKSWSRRAAYALAAVALLYTHYAAAGAVILGAGAVLLWRAMRSRDAQLAAGVAIATGIAAVLYLPWIAALQYAVGKWAGHAGAQAGPSLAVDSVLKLGYSFVSLVYGETLPLAAAIAAFILAPFVIWLLWTGLRSAPEWTALALAVAVAGFAAASRWVSFPFVPARVLFLYPLFLLFLVLGRERRRAAGSVVCAGLAAISVVSIPSYFGKRDFLNKGYAAPFDEIAVLVNSGPPAGAVVVLDTYNTDFHLLAERFAGRAMVMLVDGEESARRIRDCGARTIWYIRNAHDLSPGGLNRRLESELTRKYAVRRHLFQQYSALDRLGMALARWPERPTHFYQVLEMRARN